jgi:hypothetical protein
MEVKKALGFPKIKIGMYVGKDFIKCFDESNF